MGITKAALSAHVGRDGPAYSAWLKGSEAVKIEYAVGMCDRLKIRPAWALFEEGPKTDDEAKLLGDVRALVGSLKPASSSEHGSQRQKSETTRLSLEEVEALAAWLGRNVETMPVERPLTKAVQKIATMLIDGTVPAELPRDADITAETLESVSTAAPTSKTPRQHRQRPVESHVSLKKP